MSMSSAVRSFLLSLRTLFLPVLGLFCLILPALRAVDEVDVDATTAVAYRQGFLNGQFTITRGGSASSVDVLFHLAGNAVLGTDFDITIDVGGAPGPVLTSGGSFIASMAAGVQQITVTVIPLVSPPGPPEGQVHVDLVIDPSGSNYSIGGASSASVIIADNSMTATMSVPTPLATDDPALLSNAADPNRLRRGVIQVALSPAPLVEYRNVEVSVSGTAALGSKYNLFWKVGGSPVGAGMGYSLTYAYPTGATSFGITLPGGATFTTSGPFSLSIPGDPTAYTGSFSNTATTLVTGSTAIIGITPALTRPILVGTPVTYNGVTGVLVTQSGGYPIDSTSVQVSGGIGGFEVGDLISFTGTAGLYFLVTSASSSTIDGQTIWALDIQGAVADPSAASGFSSDDENPVALPLEASVFSEFAITHSISEVVLPPTSSQVQFSVEPTLNNPPSGAQTATLTLSQSFDYNMFTPTTGTVTIADAVVQANVSLGSNASQPNTAGSFLVSLSQAFPTSITVPYTVVPDPSNAVAGTDYFALSGFLTIPAGQTSASIPVNPIPTDAALPAGGKDVGVILSGSLDYKLAGSGTTLTNPSATLNIAPSLGVVGITASPTVAFMNPSTPGASSFTVSITRTGSSTQAVVVNYSISGTAIQGADYSPLTASTPSGYASTGTVTIPANQSSATIPIVPIEDPTSSGILQVQLTLQGGQGYTINSSGTSAVVSIESDTPVLSVVAGADASQPSTAGNFVVSYPGVPTGTALNHPLVVAYALSGSAKVGTDYANPGTVTIPAGSTSVSVPIVPTDNPLVSDESVTFTLSTAATYSIASTLNTATIALHFVPAPAATTAGGTTSGGTVTGSATGGQASFSSSSGGCGVGGGMGVLVLSLALLRRRR
jgi:hypothetical protein